MHLLVLFGPPAVGKMTVGRELAALTGYRLFHNHLTIDPLLEVFDFGTPSFVRLSGEIRRRVIEEAVVADLPGLIFTFVWALDLPEDTTYVEALVAPVHAAGGRIDYVELYADQSTRLAREGTELRLRHKPSMRDVETARARLRTTDAQYRLSSDSDFPYPERHLRIDNTALSPSDAAQTIAAGLGLTAG